MVLYLIRKECDLRRAPCFFFCQWWTLPFTNNSGRHIVTLWSLYWTLVPEVWVQDLAESMCFVLGQDTLLSPCLSPPRSINGYWWIVREAWWNAGGWRGEPCDGLASHPGGSYNYPSCFLLRKQGQAPAGGGGTRLKYSLFLLPKTVPLISQGTSKLFWNFVGC